ncbi:MAG TPA: geranylgeranyl reductase family protein [bacterium]|nr:geranylgeranyl reductase family protein [bacterium]
MSDVRDVVVVGAGPGGSAAAHHLARRGLDVVFVDRSDFPRDKTCGDGLTPRAMGLLHAMGLLPDLLRVGRCISGVEIVSPDGSSTGAAIPPLAGVPGPMLVVPRVILDDVIRERARRSGARFEGGVLVTGVERTTHGVIVRAEQGARRVGFNARCAVIATGASTPLLTRLGILRRPPPMMLAARAYFEGVTGLADRVHIRFDGVPLPGYGWVFPVSSTSVNVGAGFYPSARRSSRLPPNPRAAFDGFVRSRLMTSVLGGARQAGPTRGYPLRVDFPGSPVFGDGVLLVGEAAGLVNPLTGEGIDYALESSQIAAEQIGRMLGAGGLSREGLEEYERTLRARFERLFVFCGRLRDAALHPLLLNRLVRTAARRDDLKMLLIDIVLGNRRISETLSVRSVLRKAFALARP